MTSSQCNFCGVVPEPRRRLSDEQFKLIVPDFVDKGGDHENVFPAGISRDFATCCEHLLQENLDMITQHSQRVERLLLEHNAAMLELLSLGKIQATAGRKTEPPVVEVDAVNDMREDTESTTEDKIKPVNNETETDLTSYDDARSLPLDLYLSPLE
eukprot:CAMPEP_0194545608 /NCGR_PEP_ID=MMETSP0253-20130528/89463_1 /TAXON_ID=2966 /ORGANISM="Noctiluca scintillans" /LENGTH=155 /DNA_ID=CAMNT_0039392615 /DNA_START=1 /DNA_END=465 /DNA_ORIENTATION=+